MNVNANQTGRAHALRQRIDNLNQSILGLDGQPGDQDDRAGAVCLTQDTFLQEKVGFAQVTRHGAEVVWSKVRTSAEDGGTARHFTLEREVLAPSLFRPHPVAVYRQEAWDVTGGKDERTEARFSLSGDLLGYQCKSAYGILPRHTQG